MFGALSGCRIPDELPLLVDVSLPASDPYRGETSVEISGQIELRIDRELAVLVDVTEAFGHCDSRQSVRVEDAQSYGCVDGFRVGVEDAQSYRCVADLGRGRACS